jgi:hypothetical protein
MILSSASYDGACPFNHMFNAGTKYSTVIDVFLTGLPLFNSEPIQFPVCKRSQDCITISAEGPSFNISAVTTDEWILTISRSQTCQSWRRVRVSDVAAVEGNYVKRELGMWVFASPSVSVDCSSYQDVELPLLECYMAP